MGKTSITLAAIKILKQRGVLKKALIIAPLNPLLLTWPKELYLWLDFHGLTYAILHGPAKDQELQRDVDICFINPEGLEWLLDVAKRTTPTGKKRADANVAAFKALGFDTLVVDELSNFKHASSQRTQALKDVIHCFSRRWGLTGSPAPNGLMDLFGQCLILDEGRTLGRYITYYRREYFDQDPYSRYTYTLKDGAADKIYERLRPLALRMGADDYLELPQVHDNPIMLTMPDAARRVYAQVEKDFIAQLTAGTLVAANAAVASGMCRQIASGAAYLSDDLPAMVRKSAGQREWAEIHDTKLQALKRLTGELQGQPLLVAYDFKHTLERAQKIFGKDLPYIGGGVSTKRKMELEALWNQGRLPILFGHPKSVAHGLNLQGASACNICWLDPTWDLELYIQFIGRLKRQGSSAKRIFNHLLLMEGTVDEVILSTLRDKDKTQQALFNALKRYVTGRKLTSK